jgi:hypothetical protein
MLKHPFAFIGFGLHQALIDHDCRVFPLTESADCHLQRRSRIPRKHGCGVQRLRTLLPAGGMRSEKNHVSDIANV